MGAAKVYLVSAGGDEEDDGRDFGKPGRCCCAGMEWIPRTDDPVRELERQKKPPASPAEKTGKRGQRPKG